MVTLLDCGGDLILDPFTIREIYHFSNDLDITKQPLEIF
jgi:hypothetical protein